MNKFPTKLLNGYREFMDGRFIEEREKIRDLASKGQTPSTMIIACCDSRAAPEMIFSAHPGELFVVRNVANLVPEYAPDGRHHSTSAAIEFAVKGLGVSNIVVMGHGRCGGIAAALSGGDTKLDEGDFIGKWMSQLGPVAEQVAAAGIMTDGERQTALERVGVRQSINNLKSFPYIGELVEQDALSLHGAWFDISTAELWVMDGETGDFMRPEAS
ncbi:carbonic anhydrase [Maritalea porphyrae]|jgi:carbonic anhydrase|uniref:carbonic anhydrase n=1 Tax=Maritalea porphyrae TaxID=880732 RepID=UPI0022B0489F|nr:carbonic anhydrase [Maritalea porphyrae]MCZ4272433.1 carbonic anhydrase [Maritalea porphyrae]